MSACELVLRSESRTKIKEKNWMKRCVHNFETKCACVRCVCNSKSKNEKKFLFENIKSEKEKNIRFYF